MGQLTDKATIRFGGVVQAMEDGVTFNPGGVNREGEVHGGRTYHKGSGVAPMLEGNILHTKDTDVIALSAMTGATVIVELNTGQRYIMRQAFTTEPVPIDSGTGKSPIKISAEKVDKA